MEVERRAVVDGAARGRRRLSRLAAGDGGAEEGGQLEDGRDAVDVAREEEGVATGGEDGVGGVVGLAVLVGEGGGARFEGGDGIVEASRVCF